MSRAGAPGFTFDESGLFYRCDALLERGLAAHAFSTRLGGVSQGAFTSLNLGFHVGDRPDAVLENRRRLLSLLGTEIKSLVAAAQVHSSTVVRVGERERGRGAFTFDDALPATDALLANEPGLGLSVYTADCVPVILYDPVRGAVGVVHAGWRGTAAGIVGAAIDALREGFGTDPKDLVVALGSAIGPCCYEVGPEVHEAIRERLGAEAAGGGAGLDLWKANGVVARQNGIEPANIHACRLCTACEEELFFSYRRDGQRTGRMAAVAVVPDC